jgi:tetratricopeptide (TPR) repeat protein
MNEMKLALVILVSLLLIAQPACSRKKAGDANANSGASATVINPSDPNHMQARAYLEQGKELYRDDRDEKAAEAFQNAVKLDPELAEAYFRLGLTQEALAQDQEAENSYKKAIEKYKKYLNDNSKDAEAHYNLGQTYAGLRLYSEAVGEYRQASKLKEDDADIYYDLGLALSKLARYDEAAAAFSKSLEIDPNNYRAEDALEEAREGVQRIRAGKKHQEDLLKKKKDEDAKEGETPTPGSGSNDNRDE